MQLARPKLAMRFFLQMSRSSTNSAAGAPMRFGRISGPVSGSENRTLPMQTADRRSSMRSMRTRKFWLQRSQPGGLHSMLLQRRDQPMLVVQYVPHSGMRARS